MNKRFLQVEGHNDLVRDTQTNAIVRTSNEYTVYMKRGKQRESDGDKMRAVCGEINILKEQSKLVQELE